MKNENLNPCQCGSPAVMSSDDCSAGVQCSGISREDCPREVVAKTRAEADAMWNAANPVGDPRIHVVFNGPPDNYGSGFVEVEDGAGNSIRAGDWIERPDGFWALRIPVNPQGPKP